MKRLERRVEALEANGRDGVVDEKTHIPELSL